MCLISYIVRYKSRYQGVEEDTFLSVRHRLTSLEGIPSKEVVKLTEFTSELNKGVMYVQSLPELTLQDNC